MLKSSNIRLSSVPHLSTQSTRQLTLRTLSRLRGPRALGAILSLALAGLLSVYTCLRAGWMPGLAARTGEPPVLLLTYSA
ncbi:MAG: hypothetical protein R3C08_15110 [Hyphomonas sp.]